MRKTKGYQAFYDRNTCIDCIFYKDTLGKVPKQETTQMCTKLETSFEVSPDDTCDEFVELI
jgi:hypothetical protein